MTTLPPTIPAVEALAGELRSLGWVTDLFVAGSAATGDFRDGVSDLDLVALTDGVLDDGRRRSLVALHRRLDETSAAGASLGCAYVAGPLALDLGARHPTWTHGRLVDRPLSGIVRAELVRHGITVLGRSPLEVWPDMGDDDVRVAGQAELTGYWATAVRRPWWWLDPTLADLGLTSMARGRHTLATGTLISKTDAIDLVRAPEWLRADLRARRNGDPVRSPRVSTAWLAWADARRTVAAAKQWRPAG